MSAPPSAETSNGVNFARELTVGNYKVVLNLDEPVIAGHDHNLSFVITGPGGTPVVLADYLGAKMHAIVIKDDWTKLIHAHPASGGTRPSSDPHTSLPWPRLIPIAWADVGHDDEEEAPMTPTMTDNHQTASVGGTPFVVTFPTPGRYRVFAQFRPASPAGGPADANLGQDDYLLAAFWIEVKETSAIASAPVGVDQVAKSRTLAGTYSSVWWLRLIISLVAIVVVSLIVKRFLRV